MLHGRLRAPLKHGPKLGNIGTDDKNTLAAGGEQPSQAVGVFKGGDSLIQFIDGEGIEFIDRFTGQVEPEFGDARIQLLHRNRFTLEYHGQPRLHRGNARER